MVQVGTVALDGTKLAGNAADKANRTLDKLDCEVAEILRQAAETDQHEDRQFGDARGDELPPALASKTGRLARLRQAKAQLEAGAAERQLRYAQRVATSAATAAAKGRPPRQLKPRPRDEAPNPKATANATDPDSRFLHTRNGSVQGYNAQAVTTCQQLVVAAELTQDANDVQQLEPMLQAMAATLAAAEIAERPEVLLADSGYWSIANLTTIPDAPELLILALQDRPHRQAPQGRPALGVQQRRAARRHVRQAHQRAGQGPLRQAEGDRRAGLRPDQGRPRRTAAAAPRACRVPGGVEAAVRHPQPAQAVAPHPPPTRTHAARAT